MVETTIIDDSVILNKIESAIDYLKRQDKEIMQKSIDLLNLHDYTILEDKKKLKNILTLENNLLNFKKHYETLGLKHSIGVSWKKFRTCFAGIIANKLELNEQSVSVCLYVHRKNLVNNLKNFNKKVGFMFKEVNSNLHY